MKPYTFFALCLLLIGCASAGRNFDSRKVANIRKGDTTEKQLVEWFGPPIQRGFNSEGGATLVWSYAESSSKGENFIPVIGIFAGGTNNKNKGLLVRLDATGTVFSYDYSGGEFESTVGYQNDPENTNTVQVMKSPHQQ